MASDSASLIKDLLSKTSLSDLSEKEALDQLAHFIDAGEDAGHRPALGHSLVLAASVRPTCSPGGAALLDYFEANAWSALRKLNHKAGRNAWDWNQREFEHEVICLRRALSGKGYVELPVGRKLQVLTNLGNLMSHLGRPVEAIAYYDRALAQSAKFGMALGNRGQAFTFYSTYHYDFGHKRVFLGRARDDFTNALKYPLESAAREGFTVRLTEFDRRKLVPGLDTFDLDGRSLGRSQEERRFRQWALNERLFLNPLNDLGPYPIAARDVIQLPTIVTKLDVGTSFHGFFNQLKQEFATARWLAFEALVPNPASTGVELIADRDVMLVDARDGARFGLRLEKLKLAFRAGYSLLDKVAVFLNAYFELGLQAHTATIRSVWHEKTGKQSRRLNPRLPQDNWPLRGLYWLSKDYVESDPRFTAAMEPDAQQVATVRNRLEHQYLRITPLDRQLWAKDLAHDIPEDLLCRRTLKLLRAARAAIIYLVLAIHAHEASKKNKPSPGLIATDRLDLREEPGGSDD